MLAVNLHRKAVQVSEKETHIRQVQALNEELYELRRRADAANEAKTKFLFDMSHDIRTPMNAILGFTGLMEKNLGNPEVLKDELGKVKLSGEYLKENGKITTDIGVELTGKSVAQDRRYLKALCDIGMIEKTKSTKGNIYIQK